MSKPNVYFQVSISGKDAGRIEFQLAYDVVPKTAEKYAKKLYMRN